MIRAALILLALAVPIRDNGQWAQADLDKRAWYQSVMRPDVPSQSCCGEADAFDADIAGEEPDGSIDVTITAGPVQELIGQTIIVPRSKLQSRYGNPFDKIIVFIGAHGPLCLIPRVGA